MGLAKHRLDSLHRRDFLAGHALVNGQWISGKHRSIVTDPATGEEIATVAQCEVQEVDSAIDAAEQAFSGWRDLLPVERGDLLKAWATAIRAHADELAILITCEQGKPLVEARQEIDYGAGFLEWFAAEGERAYGDTIPNHRRASLLYTRLQPVGIVAAITPWNFPSAMITRKSAAALAAGCPVIVKPALETPLSGLALARIAQQVGVPSGVFQVVTGDGAVIANRLLDDTRVRALSFTGSTSVGRLLLERAAKTVKRVSLELGGHAPLIVFDDANVEAAVQGAMAAKFATSGQDCLAANRIYIQRSIYNEFNKAFGAAIGRLRLGHGMDPDTDIGPMTKLSVAAKCRAQIEDALARGARLITGGSCSQIGGTFVTPTLLADVSDTMLISQEETFGPIAATMVFDSEEEVLGRANASEMGLAGYVYTDDLRRALRVSDRLECGMVGVNTSSFTGPPVPFGGWKQSGVGREGSRHGLSEYLNLKYVCCGDLAA